ncbi:hypothetical protein QQ045_019174 [Rhodiola kirilowii]
MTVCTGQSFRWRFEGFEAASLVQGIIAKGAKESLLFVAQSLLKNSKIMSTIFQDEATLYDFVVTQGHGVKGLFDLGLTEVPQKCVKPPHQRIEHLNTTPSQYDHKPIDLSRLNGSNYDQQVADQIVHAAETLGFFQVINHGVPVELLEAIKIVAHEFFQQKPERKVAYAKRVSTSPFAKYVTSYNAEKETSWDWRDCLSLVHKSDAEALEHWPAECK